MKGAAAPRGFTMIEAMAVLVVLVALAAIALPAFKQRALHAGRLDAVQALMKLQSEQEQHRTAHGLYASEIGALRGVAPKSSEGRYELSLELTGAESYLARATAVGRQADDRGCAVITLSVQRGFPTEGPAPECWQR